MVTITFLFDIRREIARLEAVIEAAKGAEKTLGVLRGTAEMLEDLQRAQMSEQQQAFNPVDTPQQPAAPCNAHHEPAAPESFPTEMPEVESPIPQPKTAEFDLTDAKTLEPLTKRQSEVYNALWKLHLADTVVIVKALTELVGFHSGDAIEALVKKRYAKKNTAGYPHSFYPIAMGEPVIAVVPFPPKPINGDAARGENLQDDPAPGRSALDKKRAVDDLNAVGYLQALGHECKRITADTYELDGKTMPVKTLLDRLNRYRVEEGLEPLDVAKYL